MNQPASLTVKTLVNAPIEKVWMFWTVPSHITQWTFASSDWHAPSAENDLRVGGKFKTTMAAKDGSVSFDFEGIYNKVEQHNKIAYALANGRQVEISFEDADGKTLVTEVFDPEDQNPLDLQETGWQAILDNFKKYAEQN